MSTDQTTNLGLPFLMPAQAQKHVTVNESLLRLDALVQLAVESRTVSAQPGSPADGAVWIAPAGKTGPEWGGYTDWSLAYYRDGAWEQITPREGWRAWVKDEDVCVSWTGAAWSTALPVSTIELGHASDTTLSRSAAGVMAVEGAVVPLENRANTFTQLQMIAAAIPQFRLHETDGPTDEKYWAWRANGGNGVRSVLNDSVSGEVIFELVTRTGTTVDELEWNATLFDMNGDIDCSASAGSIFGAPTGGQKGAGTINAKAVYDDNTLLSCYVFDAALDGHVDLAKWDAKVPDWVTPEEWREVQVGVRKVEIGREVVDGQERPILIDEPAFERVRISEERIETRLHDGARMFAARLGDKHDPLTLDGYAAHWREKRHLTSLPNEAGFDPLKGLPTGAWIQRLIETVEIQAVLIEQLNQRLKAREGVAG